MSLNEKLSKLGFKDVFEIVPGLIYEFISPSRQGKRVSANRKTSQCAPAFYLRSR